MNKQTLARLKQYKKDGQKFASLTAYDSTLARLCENAGIELILVGDSLGNVIQGQDSTVPVTLEHMCYHTSCVATAINQSFLVTDMPFMSYATPEQAIDNAAELMRSGAQMVKLEGADWLEETIHFMSERGVPVCAHLGLLPQSVIKQGGYKVQGRDSKTAEKIVEDAVNLTEAGADIILLECVPEDLAKKVTESVNVPVIGIGAGSYTDSQILVAYDLLGISAKIPGFAKDYCADGQTIQQAFSQYAEEVKSGAFPGSDYTIS